jgi:hypothetical protein
MSQRSNRTLWVILALALGIPVVGVLFYGAFVGFDVRTEPGDRHRVLNIDDLGIEDFEPDPNAEKLVRTRYIDGTVGLEYEYETDDLYVWCLYSEEHTERDARNVYVGQKAGGGLMTAFDDEVELVDRPGLFSWGDESDAKVFMVDGVEAGYSIGARKGKHVFGVMITGLVYDEGALQDVVVAALERSLTL